MRLITRILIVVMTSTIIILTEEVNQSRKEIKDMKGRLAHCYLIEKSEQIKL